MKPQLLMRATLVCALTFAACSGNKGTSSPTAPSAPAAPTLQSVTLGATLSALTKTGATAQVVATGTFSNGTTSNVTSTCTGWASDNTGVLTVSQTGLMTAQASGGATVTTTCQGVFARGLVTLSLIPDILFTRSGVGDSVFDMPTYVTRVRITATPSTFCQNFVVRIAGRVLVNVILGTCSVADARTHDGTYVTAGGVTEVTISSGIAWTFTEIR